jgi:hypothetical protein
VRVFVSYGHCQGKWVHDDLVPCLKAGGVEVAIDTERFTAGKGVYRQMDAEQDACEKTLLVFSPEYLASAPCQHEMNRAIARDPDFNQGLTIPVHLKDCALPDSLKKPDPVWVDLRKPRSEPGWKQLLDAVGADLGCPAPRWLDARDELETLLGRNCSVNLVVPKRGNGNGRPKWRELLDHLKERTFPTLACVNLERGSAATRPGLVNMVLKAIGQEQPVPDKPHDLRALDEALDRAHGIAKGPPKLALTHFDMAAPRLGEYGIDLFAAIRSLVEERRVVLLVQSHRAFVQLLPLDHPLSLIQLETVELDRA